MCFGLNGALVPCLMWHAVSEATYGLLVIELGVDGAASLPGVPGYPPKRD